MEISNKVKYWLELAEYDLETARVMLNGGSYAKDNWHKDSDIDIAVIIDTIDGDYLEMASALYKLRRAVDDRIEPVLLEEKDDPSGYLDEILRHGEILYKAETSW